VFQHILVKLASIKCYENEFISSQFVTHRLPGGQTKNGKAIFASLAKLQG
jgi:hypothetical protein